MPIFPHSLTKSCTICGEVRPDDQISVLVKLLSYQGKPIGIQNIRYCNDRVDCILAAEEFSFLPEVK